LYIDRLTSAGVSQGAKIAGATSKFELIPESELKEQTGKGRSNYGQVIASAVLPGKTTIKLTINQLDAENMALALLGDVVAGSQTAGSAVAQAVTAIADRYVELGKYAISAVVVQDVTDTTTYVEGTDYLLNTRLGMIKVLSAGAISDADVLHIDYDYALAAFDTITGGTSPTIRAKLVLDGTNFVTGKNCTVTVLSARLKPTSAVDFLSDDFLPLELEGLCEIPEGATSPFTVVYHA
jgi:hypothetical protein